MSATGQERKFWLRSTSRSRFKAGDGAMVRDVTSDAQACLSAELKEAIDALTILNRHFGRETQSAALGEGSESLIAAYVWAERRERNSKGDDLHKDGHLIELKSRLIENWQDDNQFNFSKHTARARTAYCVAWRIDESNRPVLQHVFEVGVPFLVERWATPKQATYCERTTLRRLKAARQTFSCSSGSS